jgi:predicted ArsR family transcriptional regulator
VLTNCPFHTLADEQRDLVCGMNHDLLGGMAEGVGEDLLAARVAPSEGNRCVRLAAGRRAPKGR